jgi:hypothetical protein
MMVIPLVVLKSRPHVRNVQKRLPVVKTTVVTPRVARKSSQAVGRKKVAQRAVQKSAVMSVRAAPVEMMTTVPWNAAAQVALTMAAACAPAAATATPAAQAAAVAETAEVAVVAAVAEVAVAVVAINVTSMN